MDDAAEALCNLKRILSHRVGHLIVCQATVDPLSSSATEERTLCSDSWRVY
jgi:hypothetical protein